ncbi:SDR family oxidoreductase [Corynebacterium argentoratense]
MSTTAIVTGATGGMGTHIVAALSEVYDCVLAIGRNQDTLNQLESTFSNVTGVRLDLGEPDIDYLKALAVERVDCLVHAAAIAPKGPLEGTEEQQWREALQLNVIAPAQLTRALLPGLRATGGTVVFISSGAGDHGHANMTLYCATKHALNGLAEALRQEEPDIRVSTVAPGPTDTPMLQGLRGQYDAATVIAPEEVSAAVRAVVTAGPSTQLTRVDVRPRRP